VFVNEGVYFVPFMKRIVNIILFLSLSGISFSQGLDFHEAFVSGKEEFMKQSSAQKPNYVEAYWLLKQAVNLQPGNAEARYYLGHTIDKLNAEDGSKMNGLKKELTLLASEQFEKVNRIDPHFRELWLLDSYSKLSSIWGSLAIAYLSKNELDSSKWAFRNVKARGGFLEPVLEFNRQLLKSCAKNAILISLGDDLTIPMWCLQQMENIRTDVTVVDARLINAPWYIKYLKYKENLAIGYSDKEIDTINDLQWKSSDITIEDIQGAHLALNWKLKPTFHSQYIRKGDRILLDILKQNLFKRTFYFTQVSDSTCNLFLDDHLVNDGLVSRLVVPGNDSTKPATAVSKNLQLYSIDKLNAAEIKKSRSATALLNVYRYVYYRNIHLLYSTKQLDKARSLLAEMDRKFRIEKLPYSSKRLEEIIEDLRGLLK
jgi:hypothetical protein